MNRTKILLSVIFFLFASILYSQNRDTEPVTLEKISDNLYQIVGGRGANGGLYIGDEEVMIIDSKMDKESVDDIFLAVTRITDKPVKFLINTHSDGDHINGNQYFPEEVTIIAHENCRKEFLGPQRDGSPSNWASDKMIPFVPEITFQDKMELFLGRRVVELHYFGIGHTTGDLVVYFPEEKTAFIGDQVFFGRPQLIHSYKGGNSFEHVKTTQKMLDELDAEKFCSGHSEIKSRADVEQHLREMTAFQNKVKLMAEKGKNLQEIQATFADNESRLVESVYNELRKM